MTDEIETMWEGRFIVARREGRWEYVGRTRNIHAAVILAVDDGDVLLVEQYRVPLKARCLELPAGLVGDEQDESLEAAAARELEEETGYRPAQVASLGRFASSPGMVSESFTLVRATGLERVGEGGGVAGEDIVVHRVARAGVKRGRAPGGRAGLPGQLRGQRRLRRRPASRRRGDGRQAPAPARRRHAGGVSEPTGICFRSCRAASSEAEMAAVLDGPEPTLDTDGRFEPTDPGTAPEEPSPPT